MTRAMEQLDVEHTLAQLSMNDKIKLLAGRDLWHFHSVPEHGIPGLRACDGPNGVRGTRFFNGVPSSCFPCGSGLAASFDRELIREVGVRLGLEAREKSTHVVLGPTVNLHRHPLGGRTFESFSEDPHLTGHIAAAYINGLQETGVGACIKHFVANEQEFERFSSDSVMTERTLRELYLEPFRIAIRNSKPAAVMSSYNRVNGLHVSEDKRLLTDVLRNEWGFDGLVMSDWTGVYSTAESIIAGCDVEMPGPSPFRGDAVHRCLHAKKITEAQIDTCVRRILRLTNRAIASGIPLDGPERILDTPESRSVLRKAAQSAIVLLKNTSSLLPLDMPKGQTLAIIGSGARLASPSGGGSAQLACSYTTSPLDGITAAAKELGIETRYAAGITAYRFCPLVTRFAKNPKIQFYIDDPTKGWLTDVKSEIIREPDFEVDAISTESHMADIIPYDDLGPSPRCRLIQQMIFDFTPDVDGVWEFGFASIGKGNLYINGELVIENDASWKLGELFFNEGGSDERRALYTFRSGQTYNVDARHWFKPDQTLSGPFNVKAGIRVGGFPYAEPQMLMKEAEDVAGKADRVIVFVGTTNDYESEGFDRTTIALPGASDDLVRRVLAVHPDAVVITNSGAPIAMPWADEAKCILHTFFGGNEAGNGLADVVFGMANPSGKMPTTFPKRLSDTAAYSNFGANTQVPNQVHYGEGIFMGYAHHDRTLTPPLWAFGHGLSYTSFALSALSASPVLAWQTTVTFSITNTGTTAGAHAPQIYVAPRKGTTSSAGLLQEQRLQAFAKVHLQPGEKKEVRVKLGKEAWSAYDQVRGMWVVSEGEYAVRLAYSSVDVAEEVVVRLEEGFTWTGL